MLGKNLDALPADLVAYVVDINETTPNRVWPLDHVSEDGTRAYFLQRNASNYADARMLDTFATPLNPPRTAYTDYTYIGE